MGLYPKAILEYLTLIGIPRGPNSNIYIVDAANGSDSNVGDRWTSPLATVSAAYAKCTTGQHDVVLVLASTSGVSETAAITWSKNLTHLVGLGAPNHMAQRTRIVCGADDLNPFITVSGYGNIFKNLYIWQGRDDVHSLINVKVSGNRNYFENVHFAGGGHATQAIDGGASLSLDGGAENLFKECTIGVDTVAAATGMTNLQLDGGAARNEFEDCKFLLYAGHAGAMHVEVIDSTGFDRFVIFKNCLFINDCRTYTLSTAFSVPASMTSVTNFIFLKDCWSVGATDWDASNRGVLYLSGGTATAGGTTGLFQASNST
jgi:hypothetical protein